MFRAVLVVAVSASLLLTAPAPAGQATAQTPAASSLKLQQVVIDRTGTILAAAWNVTEGSAQWTPPFGQATYQYAMPSQIPPGGAPVTLAVTATAVPGSRFAPALGISGDLEIRGESPFQVGALAESGQSASASKTWTLVPPKVATGTIVRVVVGLQDGARIRFDYRATAASPAVRARSAIAWAKSQLGEEKWAFRCQAFVQRAYGANAGFRTANDAAAKLGVRKRPLGDAPIGALVYFNGVRGVSALTGHVGIYLGDGKMISALGKVTITKITPGSVWQRNYKGWVVPPASWPGR